MERPPEKWPLRALYCILAPVLAFSIVTAFGGALVPLAVAVLALAFALQHGRQVVLTESAIAAICAVTLYAYDAFPHQPPPATYDPTNRCQLQGP